MYESTVWRPKRRTVDPYSPPRPGARPVDLGFTLSRRLFPFAYLVYLYPSNDECRPAAAPGGGAMGRRLLPPLDSSFSCSLLESNARRSPLLVARGGGRGVLRGLRRFDNVRFILFHFFSLFVCKNFDPAPSLFFRHVLSIPGVRPVLGTFFYS